MKILNKYISIIILLIILTCLGCYKNDIYSNQKLTQAFIQEKNWYLEYKQFGSAEKIYVGQASYNITFFKDYTTKDSDGLKGSYLVSNSSNEIIIQFNVKTQGGILNTYNYNLKYIGDNNMILSSNINNDVIHYYYSTRK